MLKQRWQRLNQLLKFTDIYRPFESEGRFLQVSGGVESGEILAVKGASGTGKSTLLKILARLIKPHRGEMYYQGKSYRDISPLEWRREIHYVPQKPVVFEGSMEDNLRIPFTLKNTQVTYDQNAALKYTREVLLPTDLLEQKAYTLSGGEAARMSLIRALLIEPAVLLLDEPTAYLDSESASKVTNLVGRWAGEQANRAVIIVSHQDSDLDELGAVSILDLEARKVN